MALNKKTESELEISVFYLVPKPFWCLNGVKSIAHDLAPIVYALNFKRRRTSGNRQLSENFYDMSQVKLFAFHSTQT